MDLYAMSVDYDAQAPITKAFFAMVKNKLHWAITGQTAAELIYSKAEGEFEVYRQRQDAEYISDFDREVKRL